MKTKKLLVVVSLLFAVVAIGCNSPYYQTLPPELVPLARYDEAITTMVATKTSFNAAVQAEPDPAVKKQMLDIAYPMFKRADAALVVWKQFIDTNQDPTAKIRAYQTIWYELVNALLQMGIVEVK